MPISIALPAPNVEWVSEYFSPLVGAAGVFIGTHGHGVAGPISVVAAMNSIGFRPPHGREAWLQVANPAQSHFLQGYGTVGAGNAERWALHNGRQCMWDQATVAAVTGDLMVPDDWLPLLLGPVPAGALQDDASVVGVFDFHIATDLAGAVPAGWSNDAVGFYFLPFFPNSSPTVPSGGGISCRQVPGSTTGTPGDPDDVGGFGVFINDDGAGGTTLEYVSWGTGSPGAILERIRPSAAILPNVVNWNSVRFVIVGARPGRAATLSVQVNSNDILPVREFGSPQLNLPGVSAVGAAGFAIGFNSGGGAAVFPSFFTQWHMKFGRFTPSGEEIQGP